MGSAVGSKVENFKVGDRVCGMNKRQSVFSEAGTWAEYTVTQSKNIVKIPDDVGFQEAAASVLPLFVIHGMLDFRPKIKGGEKIVVIGASGGIGSMLITVLRQLCQNDIYIVGICSGKNEDFVRALGCDRVIDYTKGQVKNELKKEGLSYDVVFDLIGGQSSYNIAKEILSSNKNGRFVTPTGPVEWVGDTIMGTIWNFIPGSHPYYHLAVPTDLDVDTFQSAFNSGISPHIEKCISFENRTQFEEAIELVRSHRARGKVIVEID